MALKAAAVVEEASPSVRDQVAALRDRLARTNPAFAAAMEIERGAELLCLQVREDLKARRQALGISQKELAHRVELSQSAISKLEGGAGDISLKTLYRVARALEAHPIVPILPTAEFLAGSASQVRTAASDAASANSLAVALEQVQGDLIRQIPEIIGQAAAAARLAAAE